LPQPAFDRVKRWLTLDLQDVDLQSGILAIRHTKFGKSRFVPMEGLDMCSPCSLCEAAQ
jgi:hypothetical protein